MAYFEETPMEDLAGDAFILFINIFDDKSTPPHITPGCLDKLFKSIEFITDEGTQDALVGILVSLMVIIQEQSLDADDIVENPILKQFINDELGYREKILHLTNQGKNLEKCCKTIAVIMSLPDKGEYFNANDISALVDILLRESQTNMDSKVRIAALSLLEVVLNNKVYQEHKFRREDIEDMVQQAILYDDDQPHDEYEMECLASLNQFFEVERMGQ